MNNKILKTLFTKRQIKKKNTRIYNNFNYITYSHIYDYICLSLVFNFYFYYQFSK